MVYVAQLARALDCGSRGQQFDPAHTHHAPVAQLDEHFATNETVGSSNLSRCTNCPRRIIGSTTLFYSVRLEFESLRGYSKRSDV